MIIFTQLLAKASISLFATVYTVGLFGELPSRSSDFEGRVLFMQ